MPNLPALKNNDIKVFDSKHTIGRGQTWTPGHTALASAMVAVPTFFIAYVLMSMVGMIAIVAWPALAVVTGKAVSAGVRNHRLYGLSAMQAETVLAIDNLPPEVRGRYGDDYVTTVRQIGDSSNAQNLYSEVNRLAKQAERVEENRREHELAPVVEAMRTTTKEVAAEYLNLDPGPLAITSGRASKDDVFTSRRSRYSDDEDLDWDAYQKDWGKRR